MSDTHNDRILILSDEAEAYASELAGLDTVKANSAMEAASAWNGERVVLGEPDKVAEALPRMPGVEWVQSTWAGVLPLLDAARDGITVTGVKGVFGQQMAEYALGYMLAHELGIFERKKRQDQRDWWQQDTGNLRGKRLGVMGTGSIGQAVAEKAAALGVRVVGYSRSGEPVSPFESVYEADDKLGFLARLDYLVCVLPDTPDTTLLLNREAFCALPSHCVLINVGRGNVIDDEALLEALSLDELGGAVLDVFRDEPLPSEHPFWSAPRLLVTAHVAAKSYPADIAAIFIENHRRYLAGEELQYVFDPDRGY